jgi:hypothetical protein
MVVLLVADDTWVEVALDRRWTAAYRIGLQHGALVVTELRIFPTEQSRHRPVGGWSADVVGARAKAPRGGITATGVLANIRIRQLLQSAARMLRKLDEEDRQVMPVPAGSTLDGRPRGERRGLLADLPRNPSAGTRRPRISDSLLQRVAEAYRLAGEKDLGRVNVLVAERLFPGDRRGAQRVRDLVWLARQRGFLPKTKRGVASIERLAGCVLDGSRSEPSRQKHEGPGTC